MSKWLLVAGLALEAHFAASYLVPLDEPSQKEFGGLLRWFWPWAFGDGGLLGQITPAAGFPMTGFILAAPAAGCYCWRRWARRACGSPQAGGPCSQLAGRRCWCACWPCSLDRPS
jgi:hypothetical protein